MKYIIVYITAKDKKEARVIGEALVKARLAACVNIIGRIDSIYRWKGKIERGKEILFIAKTKKGLLKKVERKVRALHSYRSPCVLSIPITGGSAEYLKWLHEETA